MTAPGSMALAFRLFDDDALRVRASALISTIGLVGLAIGPMVGGLALAVLPWQVLLVTNAPIALVALAGVHRGIPRDQRGELHEAPLDLLGALLGTTAIILTLVSPTLFLESGPGNAWPWLAVVLAIAACIVFALRERTTRHPLVDFALLGIPLVARGLAFQAALGLALAGLGYAITLQLQLAWGWPPALAALGLLPQILTMIAAAPFVERIVRSIGMDRAALLGAGAVIVGLALYAVFGRFNYTWIALALVTTAAGMRLVMITSTISVMRGLPKDRTSLGAALNDTSQEVATSIGIALTGTVIAALFVGSITSPGWSDDQIHQFNNAVTISALTLATLALIVSTWAALSIRRETRN